MSFNTRRDIDEALLQTNAARIVHDTRKEGRPLLDHLKGVERLLEIAGYSKDICLAGLLHSIYGTNRFHHSCIDPYIPGERERIRASVGERAEKLAYLFHQINRPITLHDNLMKTIIDNDVELSDRKGSIVLVSKDDFSALIAIEIANLLEQGDFQSERWPLFVKSEHFAKIKFALVQLLEERARKERNWNCSCQ